MRRRSRGVLPLILGSLLIVAALCLVVYNIWDAERAANAANEAVDALMDEIPSHDAEKIDNIPVVTVEDNQYIGILEIPSLGITLPVMADWDYENLKISPCRFTGSCETRDLVICAHNYRTHFGPIRHLGIGEDVYLTTVDGQVYHYTVSNRQVLRPVVVEVMAEQEMNEWDLTLFTCTLGGKTRHVVRCVLE